MIKFLKETADIPNCCRTQFSFEELAPFRHLKNLPNTHVNAHKKTAKRQKWDVIKDDWRNEGLLETWPQLKTLLENFPCERIRKAHISEMPPGSKLLIHRDGYVKDTNEHQSRFHFFNETLRFHIPLKTNDRSLFYCAGKFYKMNRGECWMFNNFRNHSAINMNKIHGRFHLIFDVIPNEETMALVETADPDLGFENQRVLDRLKSDPISPEVLQKVITPKFSGPDFFILGAMKSGTTSLFHYMSQHPKILPPAKKELNYYGGKQTEHWTLADYVKQFPKRRRGELSGEATPYYLLHPLAPRLIKEDFPDARFIVILRNPVDRAYSHYWQRYRKGKETRSFSDAIRNEKDFFTAFKSAYGNQSPSRDDFNAGESYLTRGHYAHQLRQWFQFFPREKFRIILTDDFKDNGFEEVQETYKFLGLPRYEQLKTDKTHNSRDYEPMSKEDRKWAENYFKPRNANLSRLLGRELPW